jgi:hypothetical protein
LFLFFSPDYFTVLLFSLEFSELRLQWKSFCAGVRHKRL